MNFAAINSRVWARMICIRLNFVTHAPDQFQLRIARCPLGMRTHRPPRQCAGDDLISLGFARGKIIGEILRALEDEQLEGRIATSEDAKDFVEANWKIE